MIDTKDKILIGGREVVLFPELNLTLRAKIDTGAKTSSLHATDIQVFEKDTHQWVSFQTLNEAGGTTRSVECEFRVYDHRQVRSSNGQAHWRYVIKTQIQLGKFKEQVELTLADRSKMQYPMLLGRAAMKKHFLVAPGKTYLQGSPPILVCLETDSLEIDSLEIDSLENKCT